MQNVLENIPYQAEGMGRRKLVDKDQILIMQAALKPGQSVPPHDANADVHILVLTGEVVINLNGTDTIAKAGNLLPVAIHTPMNITNNGPKNATFLIIKAPDPY
ncbi:MAG: cupin domain-containing protein [Thermodesulfobacteriota bacterium]